MRPSAFVFLESLPCSPEEKIIAEIWAEILNVNKIGVHDNFFELGVYSLVATQIVSQVVKKFHLEAPLQSLFPSSTVAAMATIITEHQAKTLGAVEVGRILSELESLSDDDATKLLAEQGAPPGSTDTDECDFHA